MENTLLLFYTCVSITQSAKILGIFPYPGNSHFTCNNAVLKSLAEAGHKITVITSFPDKARKENYTSVIDVSDGEFTDIGQSAVEDFSRMSVPGMIGSMTGTELSFCEKVLSLKEIQKILKSEKHTFDVIFVEILLYQHCYYFIGRKLNIPVIGIVTYRSWIITDMDTWNPRHLAVTADEIGKTANLNNFYARLDDTRIFVEKIGKYYWDTRVKGTLVPFFQKYAQSYMPYKEFMEIKPSLIFLNSHCSYFPRPLNPNVIEIGGITLAKNTLSRDVQMFLDGAEYGAILFTFGSVVRAARLPKNKVQAFVAAFAEIPQRVIWKYEEQLDDVSDNVMLMKWVPQQDILAHKNTKAFISHCGQGAIQESIYHGVPLVSCPLFDDQYENAQIFENLQIAVHLEYETITKHNALNALNEVINNTQYYEKMQKQSQLFRDRPMSPQEAVVYWTEYVIRHKSTTHLLSPANNLYWFQYFLLDVICFVIFAMLVILYLIRLICKLILCLFKCHRKNTLKNKIA